ncbi:GAF and ANTAR domain-containing protein [Amycolatopsis sp. WQ 127309]|uniref:GAF and ANTAR domain-containing protein n=1 Tax=Amycolatopsis sp. WQ 127309 TaxID=2932773 RepID=UPI001FF33DEB|nr:GAF and ANTAR domain-containing protein [Amycolatopsis sp. WQ 127309]UOZ04905.1 GAF and ANTAR domain-containing protein [Amycolatopsis sp. WQ 127309]
MVENRRHRMQALLAADGADRRASAVSLACERCVLELSVSGAGATVLSKTPGGNGNGNGLSPSRGLVHATNPVSAGLEDLQLTVGEGPCLDAFATGGPVLISDLSAATARWPAFTPAACELGAAAVFSFPLQVGVVRLGSLDLYRDTTGPLTRVELADALILSDLATQGVVADLDGHRTEDVSWLADPHAQVHQATGMVQVQLDSTTDVALMRLRGYAFTHNMPLADVARRVVERSLRFTDTEDGQ